MRQEHKMETSGSKIRPGTETGSHRALWRVAEEAAHEGEVDRPPPVLPRENTKNPAPEGPPRAYLPTPSLCLERRLP